MMLTVTRDALVQLLCTPTAAQLWQRLTGLIKKLQPDERADMQATLSELQFDHPAAEWLRCSAMAGLCGDASWFARQAALVDGGTPADAIVGLLYLAWHQALVLAGDHAAFEQVLHQADAVRLQRLASLQLADGGRPPGASLRTALRVAVYTPDIASDKHGGTTFTLNVLNTLTTLGIETCAFAGQESNLPSASAYCAVNFVVPPPVRPESLRLDSQRAVEIKLASTALSLPARMAELLAMIHDYRPDVVIFVGYLSPAMYRLYQHYPVVGLSVHAVAPLVPMDSWLAPTPDGRQAAWPQLPAASPVYFPCRFRPVGDIAPMPRADAGLPAEAPLLATCGSRLDMEMDIGWTQRMVALLDTHSDAHWLLIGVVQGSTPPGLPSHPRIHVLPPQLNLAQWLAMCDIYANPPRLGGGGSVAMAMELGLAVAAYAATDGGDKTGASAADSADAYFALLHGWLLDPASRRTAGREMRERFVALLDMSAPQAGERLAQACRQALDQFEKRKEVVSE